MANTTDVQKWQRNLVSHLFYIFVGSFLLNFQNDEDIFKFIFMMKPDIANSGLVSTELSFVSNFFIKSLEIIVKN